MASPPAGVPQIEPEAYVKQFQEFLSSYNKVTQKCFTDCANDFTTRKVLDSESSCAINCMEKYLKMTQRITQRFQEYQLMNSESAMQGMTGS